MKIIACYFLMWRITPAFLNTRRTSNRIMTLSISDGLVLLDSRRFVLPLPAIRPILNLLHSSHSGVNKTIVLARGLYYWPGMINDIKQLVSHCTTCIRVQPSQPFSPMSTPPPSTHLGYPMQHVGLDLFSYGGKQYLICVDHWSGYPLYSLLRSLNTDTIIAILTNWFNILGWPSSIQSDGGPQFRGPFFSFCNKNNISHELAAPYNPKSNGLAEAAVKSVKSILRKSSNSNVDPHSMLYEWRNVPRSDGYSPAQLLFGRRQRTNLPILPLQNRPINFNEAASSKDAVHTSSADYHDLHKKILPTLTPGKTVLLQEISFMGLYRSSCLHSAGQIVLCHSQCWSTICPSQTLFTATLAAWRSTYFVFSFFTFAYSTLFGSSSVSH